MRNKPILGESESTLSTHRTSRRQAARGSRFPDFSSAAMSPVFASGPSAALLLLLLLLLAPAWAANLSSSRPQMKCSKVCVAENCNSVGIRYGKFCGVGWTGCPGEKPCDDLDACCKIHDECVEKKGMMSVRCHEKFKSCIKKVQKSGTTGFSKVCPYETAMPTMVQGMDMAILFSQLGSSKQEL